MKFSKRMLFGMVAIALSLLLIFVGIPIVNSASQQKVRVIRVKEKIEKGTSIKNTQIEYAEVPLAGVPNGAIAKPEDVLGKYAIVDMVPGDYIMAAKLSSYKLEETSIYNSLGEDQVAVTISAGSFAGILANKIQAGDIIKFYNITGDRNNDSIEQFWELQYVKVMEVSNSKGKNVEEAKEEDSKNAAAYTFVVTERQALKLMQLEHYGNYHLTLISRGNIERAEMLLDEQNALLEYTADEKLNADRFKFDEWETEFQEKWKKEHKTEETKTEDGKETENKGDKK